MSKSPASILYDSTGQHPVGVILDGAVYRLQAETKMAPGHGLATETKQDSILTELQQKTEPADLQKTVLYDASGNAVTIAADGSIYRVSTRSQLQTQSKGTTPVGYPTSEAIDANSNALHVRTMKPTEHPHYDTDIRIVDIDGNTVGLVLDGTIYRLQTASKVAKGSPSGGLVYLDALDTETERGRLKTTLYSAYGEAINFFGVSPDPSNIINDFCKNGGSDSLLVNGSSTPVAFTYPCHATKPIAIQEVRLTIVANSVTFGSDYFGARTGPLTNGVLVEAIIGGVTATLYNLKQNESFVNFSSPGGFQWVVSSKDLCSSSLVAGGALKLLPNSSDCIKVTIRDSLIGANSAGTYFKCFVKGNLLPL